MVNNAKSKRCMDCGFVYYFNPSAAVACFVRDATGNLLVAVRGNEPAKGKLDLPGGFVDMDETGEEAARRELMEETGLSPDSLRYLFSIPNIYPYSGFEVQTLDIFFECTVADLTEAIAADDVAALTVIAPGEVDAERFGLKSVREAIARYIK